MKTIDTTGPEHATSVSSPLHILPALPYACSALEPVIDTRTMTLHHDVHHGGYVDKLNALLAPYPELRGRSAQWLLVNPREIPEIVRSGVMNNAGGHVNHCLFWQSMCPPGGRALSGPLLEAIRAQYGTPEEFRLHFQTAGAQHFGSGWVWLVMEGHRQPHESMLRILTTPAHENPAQRGHWPLLVNDLWEHAYYLKHENRRQAYLEGWWLVANWNNAMDRFAHSMLPTETADKHNLGTPASQSALL